MTKRIISAEEYCDLNVPLSERFARLADAERYPDSHSDGVNTEIAGFVVRYASAYFNEGSIDLLRKFRRFGAGDESTYKEVMDCLGHGKEDAEQAMALACLLDVHTSAALFREIAFAKQRSKPNETTVGADFGSGTGILTVAAAVAAVRNGVKATIYGFEKNPTLIARSQMTIDSMTSDLSSHGIDVCIESADIINDEPYRRIVSTGLPLRYWISETFNRGIPSPTVQEGKLVWPEYFAKFKKLAHLLSDPFVDVVQQSVKHFPNLIEDVQNGRTVAFPDFVRGGLESNRHSARLRIAGTLRNFSDIGTDFEEFENLFPHARFPNSPLAEYHDTGTLPVNAYINEMERTLLVLERMAASLGISLNEPQEEILPLKKRKALLAKKMQEKKRKK